MRKAVRDALLQVVGHHCDCLVAERLAHCNQTEGQGQSRFGMPPFAKVPHLHKPQVAVGQLALMDDETRRNRPILYCSHDLIKRHRYGFEVPQEHP